MENPKLEGVVKKPSTRKKTHASDKNQHLEVISKFHKRYENEHKVSLTMLVFIEDVYDKIRHRETLFALSTICKHSTAIREKGLEIFSVAT